VIKRSVINNTLCIFWSHCLEHRIYFYFFILFFRGFCSHCSLFSISFWGFGSHYYSLFFIFFWGFGSHCLFYIFLLGFGSHYSLFFIFFRGFGFLYCLFFFFFLNIWSNNSISTILYLSHYLSSEIVYFLPWRLLRNILILSFEITIFKRFRHLGHEGFLVWESFFLNAGLKANFFGAIAQCRQVWALNPCHDLLPFMHHLLYNWNRPSFVRSFVFNMLPEVCFHLLNVYSAARTNDSLHNLLIL